MNNVDDVLERYDKPYEHEPEQSLFTDEGELVSQGFQALALRAVAHERRCQDEQWGVTDHDPVMWSLLISKHAGKLADEVVHWLATRGGGDSADAIGFLSCEQRAIKIAALCVAFSECIGRGTWL